MRLTGSPMPAARNDLSSTHDHRTNRWIGTRVTQTLRSFAQGGLHEFLVIGHRGSVYA
jgi:hypothetical protein